MCVGAGGGEGADQLIKASQKVKSKMTHLSFSLGIGMFGVDMSRLFLSYKQIYLFYFILF